MKYFIFYGEDEFARGATSIVGPPIVPTIPQQQLSASLFGERIMPHVNNQLIGQPFLRDGW